MLFFTINSIIVFRRNLFKSLAGLFLFGHGHGHTHSHAGHQEVDEEEEEKKSSDEEDYIEQIKVNYYKFEEIMIKF